MSLFATLEAHSSRVALIAADGAALPYVRMLADGDALAAALPRTGGRALVLVICRNDGDCVSGYVGLMRAGAAVMLLHHSQTPDQSAEIVARFRPGAVFAPADCGWTNGPVLARLGAYVLAATGHDAPPLHPDLALLLTTSGTTGSRNFVRLTQANILTNAVAIAQYLDIGPDERPITTLPLSYSYGLSILHSHLLRGASVVLTEDSVVSPGFWAALKRHKVTSLGGVPFIYEMLKTLRFGRMDLPDLRTLTQAGGRMAPERVAEFAEICARTGKRLIVMYGQTEATARIAWMPWDALADHPGSIGQAVPGGRLWLEDETGAEITASGTTGELIYAGGNVGMGYAADAADLARGDDNGGVLRTGDMAERDADGFFRIVGRRKRFVKVFGHRVNLDDLERLLHGQGVECACTGDDDALVVHACGATPDAVRAVLSAQTGLTIHMVRVVMVDTLPRQESGKVDYRALEAAHVRA